MTNYKQPPTPTTIEEIVAEFESKFVTIDHGGNHIISEMWYPESSFLKDWLTQTLKDYGDAVRGEVAESLRMEEIKPDVGIFSDVKDMVEDIYHGKIEQITLSKEMLLHLLNESKKEAVQELNTKIDSIIKPGGNNE